MLSWLLARCELPHDCVLEHELKSLSLANDMFIIHTVHHSCIDPLCHCLSASICLAIWCLQPCISSTHNMLWHRQWQKGKMTVQDLLAHEYKPKQKAWAKMPQPICRPSSTFSNNGHMIIGCSHRLRKFTWNIIARLTNCETNHKRTWYLKREKWSSKAALQTPDLHIKSQNQGLLVIWRCEGLNQSSVFCRGGASWLCCLGLNSPPANFASVSASTFTPLAMASSEENSSGRWLHPFLHGMKIIPVGATLLNGWEKDNYICWALWSSQRPGKKHVGSLARRCTTDDSSEYRSL